MRRYEKEYEKQQDAYEQAALFLRSLEMLLWTMAAVGAVWLSYRLGLQCAEWLWLLFAAPFGVVWLVIRALQHLHERMFLAKPVQAQAAEMPKGYLRPDAQGIVRNRQGQALLVITGHRLEKAGTDTFLLVEVGNLAAKAYGGVSLKALLYDRQEQLLGVAQAELADFGAGAVWQVKALVKPCPAVRAVLCFHLHQE